MLTGFASQTKSWSLSKAWCQLGLAALAVLLGAGAIQDATAEGETRTLSFHHTHSNEDLTVTFKRDGTFDEDALKQLNHFLRDWRTQEETTMDRHLFDILWEVYREVDGRKPIQIISAYRSPATNAMLRRRSSGVARFSQHMLGHAMDFFIPDVPLEKIRFAGLRLQRGGVGFYPTSGSPFVHLDTGSIRHWPRMTHEQLARLFPDGRTVHVPSDGKPLKGYELARADIEQRDSGDGALTRTRPSLFAALFGRKPVEEDDEPQATAALGETSPMERSPAKSAEPIPTPRARPAIGRTLQLASADADIVPTMKAAAPASAAATRPDAKAQNAADIVNSRGIWDDTPAKPPGPAEMAAADARRALAAADPLANASIATRQALAYAPPSTSQPDHAASDRANGLAAGVNAPHLRPSIVARNLSASPAVADPVITKGLPGQGSLITTRTRLAADSTGNSWIRVMMLAPSASSAMSVTVLGDTDMPHMRLFFVKPATVISLGFADDPQFGMLSDRFTGSATAVLSTRAFATRTASLH